MPEIDLSLIRPNPFRDFSLHPIDPVQVDRLKASIGADGFWASVVARKVGDNYQIAFGHHRIEAAKLRELSTVPMERAAARRRINAAALKAEKHLRYAINYSPKDGYRVKLIALYAKDRPKEIAARADGTTKYWARETERLIRMAEEAENVDEGVKMFVRAMGGVLVVATSNFRSTLTEIIRQMDEEDPATPRVGRRRRPKIR